MAINKLSRYAAIGISLLIIGAVFYLFSDLVAYVLVAWVLSMMGQPLMVFFRKLKLGKGASAGLTLVIFMLLFTTIIWIFVPPIVQQARNLAGIDYASLVKSLEEPINSFNNLLIEKGLLEGEMIDISEEPNQEDSKGDEITQKTPESDSLVAEIIVPLENEKTLATTFVAIDSILLANGDTVTKTNITLQINIQNENEADLSQGIQDTTALVKDTDTPIEKIQKRLFSTFNPARITGWFSTIVGFMGNLVIAILSILFISFFFLKEQGLFTNILKALVPTEYESEVIHAVDESSRLLRRYFLGVSLQISIITIFMWIVLSFIGIQNALLIAFFAALINVVPYVGPLIGAAFGVIITISSNLDISFYDEMLPILLMVVGAFGVMQLMDNFILQPIIFSNSVSAHPLEIFMVILIGAKLSGIMGMVLAIPVYTVIRVIAKAFLSEFKIVKKLTNSLNET